MRRVEAITSLRDVALVTTAAYPSATAELRNAPEPVEPIGSKPTPTDTNLVSPTEEAAMPEETPQGGGLTLESRSAPDPAQTVEARYFDAIRSVPRGESRSLTLATAASVEPAEMSTFLFDQLRPRSVVLASGVPVVSTDRKSIKYPTLTGDVLADFVGELDPIDATDPTLDEIEITPKSIKSLGRASSEALDDSSPSLLTIVQNNLNTVLALKLDAELLVGASENGFDGILNTDNRQTLSGATLVDYSWFVKAVSKLVESHVPGPYEVLMHPRTACVLGLLKEFDAAK